MTTTAFGNDNSDKNNECQQLHPTSAKDCDNNHDNNHNNDQDNSQDNKSGKTAMKMIKTMTKK